MQLSTSEARTGLAQRSLNAVFWGGAGALLRLALQLGAQIALARILGPQQYGVFAVGATVIGFSAFLSDIGLAYGLIQKPEVGADDIRFVFTWQIVLGLAVTALVYLTASPLAAFFGEARAAGVLRAMSLLCLLNALGATSLNLLRRRLDFKSIQFAQIVSYVVGYIACGLPLALAGAGYWALVAAWLIQSALNGLLLYRAAGHPLRPLAWYGQAIGQGRYALTVLATNLTNWLIGNIDRVVVARVFGSRDIGLYATIYNLLYNPSATLLGVVQPVFFSASSRITDDPQRVAQGYRTLIGALALFVLPPFACLAVLGDSFVPALYGPNWLAAAGLVAPLALAMPLFLLFGLTTPLLWTSGRPQREFLLQLPVALVWLGACVLAARGSLPAVAWTVLVLFVLRTGVVVRAASRAMGLAATDLWRAMRGGVAVALACAALAALVERALPAEQPALLHLLAGTLAGFVGWLAIVRGVRGAMTPDTLQLLHRLAAHLPRALRRFVDAIDQRHR